MESKKILEFEKALNRMQKKYKTLERQHRAISIELQNQEELVYEYKNEYERLLNSKVFKTIHKIKARIGKTYKPKYINRVHNPAITNKYMDAIEQAVNSMSISNGSKFYDKFDLKIGIICDEFLFNAYKDAAHFCYITPNNYEEQIHNIDFMIVVTTWYGIDNEWLYLSNVESDNTAIIKKVIELCKDNNIKTVFYSKEDPPHFYDFLHIAKECDMIFTSDEHCIEDYEYSCDGKPVNVLNFCINPIYHNPIGLSSTRKDVIFSGAWYSKFRNRSISQQMIFDGVLKSKRDLVVVDRNYNTSKGKSYPSKYINKIVANIEHNKLQKVHHLHEWAINISTITDSDNMFANRVYELQAIGNLLISNYSVGIYNKFPQVFLATNKNETANILNSLNDEEIYLHRLHGIRKVMSRETCFERLAEMIDKAGFDVKVKERFVCVVADVIDENIKRMFASQTYRNRVLISAEDYTEEIHNKYDIITFWNHRAEYEMFYLEDMINAFKYTNCDYITKDSYFKNHELCPGKEHDYVQEMKDKNRTVFWAKTFTCAQLKSFDTPQIIQNGYSIDRYHYNEELVDTECREAEQEYKISIIIPTYNNGDFLYGKAFSSLLRSSMFEDIEVVIVDAGSTDKYTPELIKYLQKQYKNISTYFYNDEGSGSISRARKKGVKMAKAEYISFLDPNNESIGDAYAKMYKKLHGTEQDFIASNTLEMSAENKKISNQYTLFKKYVEKNHITDVEANYFVVRSNKDIINDMQFQLFNVQASLIRRDYLINNELTQFIGGSEEDSLLTKQLINCSNQFGVTSLTGCIYYAKNV